MGRDNGGRAELCVVPRISTQPIELTESERAELERRASTVTLAFRTVQRARMILYAAEGMQDIDIAARLDSSPDSVARRRARGRAVFPPEQVAEVKALACELPKSHELPLSSSPGLSCTAS